MGRTAAIAIAISLAAAAPAVADTRYEAGDKKIGILTLRVLGSGTDGRSDEVALGVGVQLRPLLNHDGPIRNVHIGYRAAAVLPGDFSDFSRHGLELGYSAAFGPTKPPIRWSVGAGLMLESWHLFLETNSEGRTVDESAAALGGVGRLALWLWRFEIAVRLEAGVVSGDQPDLEGRFFTTSVELGVLLF